MIRQHRFRGTCTDANDRVFHTCSGTHKLQYKHALILAPYERQGTTLQIQKFPIADNHTCVENTMFLKAVERFPARPRIGLAFNRLKLNGIGSIKPENMPRKLYLLRMCSVWVDVPGYGMDPLHRTVHSLHRPIRWDEPEILSRRINCMCKKKPKDTPTATQSRRVKGWEMSRIQARLSRVGGCRGDENSWGNLPKTFSGATALCLRQPKETGRQM